MKISKILTTGFVCFCVATMLAECAGAVVMWSRGWLTGDKLYGLLAVAYGVDAQGAGDEERSQQHAATTEDVAYDEIQQQRFAAALNLALRDSASEMGLVELRLHVEQLKIQRDRIDELKASFDKERSQSQRQLARPALDQLSTTLMSMPPRQAKDHLLLFLDEAAAEGDAQAIDDVVALLRSMPTDKRKRILGEFKSPAEQEQLASILRHLRLGKPDIVLIRKTKRELHEIAGNTTEGIGSGTDTR